MIKTYQIVIRRDAKKKLESLSRVDRVRITEKIILLGKNPLDSKLDVKLLAGSMQYRLRVGSWRIIFDRQDDIKVISIEKIGARGDVYK